MQNLDSFIKGLQEPRIPDCHFPDRRIGKAGVKPDKASSAKRLAVTPLTVANGGRAARQNSSTAI